MKLNENLFQEAIDFGTFHSREHFFPFTLKCLFYIIPAVILGKYTDVIIKKIKKVKKFGDSELYYILLQTLIILSTLYLILSLSPDYLSEFQETIAGGFFVVLYFGIQTNYIPMIKEYINTF